MTDKSLDQLDREAFNPGPAPMEGAAVTVELRRGLVEHPARPHTLSLDGMWEMAEGGSEADRLTGNWADSIPAAVPGSVHSALLAAGRIPDPYVGRNDEIARQESLKTWWLKRVFKRPEGLSGEKLVFGGICDSCDIWLNGEKLGGHKGMFAELVYGVTSQLADGDNTLMVKLDPAPFRLSGNEPNAFFQGMNIGWLDTAVINNIFGWHYINLPTIGIWRPVRLDSSPTVTILHPFVATLDAGAGVARLNVTLAGDQRVWSGRLVGTVEPENFEGAASSFSHDVRADGSQTTVLLEFSIPDAKPWWPVDHGDPNLYRLTLSFLPMEGGSPDRVSFAFGLRTIEMRPLPDGPKPDTYNWTFVVNGKPIFIKGANWCTLDALLRFEPARYDRFLRLARDSHFQLLRAWGSGMPEIDEFYDLADRYGVMVLQEWPTAWNSHQIQPYDILEETVRHNTLRLRNHPSLAMWGAGNESNDPTGPAIDMMGRLAVELDGTRPFHRGEPWGGSIHNYDVYWGRQPLDRNLRLTAPFIGEFGLASVPNEETVRRYLPDDERELWPPPADGGFVHHMPVFNTKGDMAIMSQYVADFAPVTSIKNFITGTQMAQATGIRHTLERARTRWPDATGAVYYKLNDNNPAAAWSTVDWFGVPKRAYHFLRQAFRPLHACVLFERLSSIAEPLALPVWLLDDANALDGTEWQVIARAYDAHLDEIERATFAGSGAVGPTRQLGEFRLTVNQTRSAPLLIVCEVRQGDEVKDRTFYWLNYTAIQGCLFALPKTRLSLAVEGPETLVVTNTGERPAVAVHFVGASVSDTFSCADSYFWLDPAERRKIAVNRTDGVTVAAWNAD
jgi:beta-mannosidase